MTWTYEQETGLLSHNGAKVWHGYSGHGPGLNSPDHQDKEGVGPIPQGRWRIGAPHDSQHTGPFTLPLTPERGTETFGRTAFAIHGDNYHRDNSASHGCVILARPIREQIHESADNDLEVVSGRAS